jgi:DNA-3-methyladenine glycosylase I
MSERATDPSSQQDPVRCDWCKGSELYMAYHDREWGVPVYDDRRLFEFLVLEGAQAGLSWLTILKKREAYRDAFGDFDPQTISGWGKRELNRLLKNPGIVRNKLKLTSAINNARAFLKVQEEFGSFSSYQWSFVGNKPRDNRFKSMKQIPAETDESRQLSRDLKRRGFNFVGPTIVYAHMQAVGMVNDHLTSCFRHAEVARRA